MGTQNTKVPQPVCFYPNGAQSSYDLNGSFASAGLFFALTLPSMLNADHVLVAEHDCTPSPMKPHM